MNIKHIQYIVEIDRVRSISQAAENLYIGQPNLSRILKDVEDDIGFSIFLRTTHGVKPTERGASFLRHARNILREMESIQTMSPNQMVENRLRICIPRSGTSFDLTGNYLKTVCEEQNIHVTIRVSHAREAFELLSNGNAEIGIIRFRQGYEAYFQEIASASKLAFHPLSHYDDVVLMHKSHPLAGSEKIRMDALKQHLLITHSDRYLKIKQAEGDCAERQIYTVDRYTQLTLLGVIPGSYMWSAPLNAEELNRYDLVQKSCSGHSRRYCEALIYNNQLVMNSLESAFIGKLLERS